MRHNALVGRKVAGRFTIKRFLGEGGMATVYVAEQEAEPREIALKIMNQDLMSDRTFVRRFQREAKASSRVQHPNSVQIIDWGIEGNLSYIAMELVLGDDLYVLLEREGAISQARAVRILVEVCDALMVAHELGIVHRDLKPENIMVIADPAHPSGERVKVLDFGIAKLLAQDAIADEQSSGGRDPRADPSSAVTRAGTFIGTPAYMSPEQCSLLAVDTRADIYTCGVLLFQLVTGKLPFEGQTPLHTATLHIHQAPPDPASFAPGIDPRLSALILKALSKRPAERHQTARHLGTSLRKILPELADVTVGTGKPSKRPGNSGRAPSAALTEVKIPPPPAAPGAMRSPDSDAMESAKTMVAEGAALPPPSVVLHDAPAPGSDPPARIQFQAPAFPPPPASSAAPVSETAPSSDDESDNFRTLVRLTAPEDPSAPRLGITTLQSESMSAPQFRAPPMVHIEEAPPTPVMSAPVRPGKGTEPMLPPMPRQAAPIGFAVTQPAVGASDAQAALQVALRNAAAAPPPPMAEAPRMPPAPLSAPMAAPQPVYPEPKSRAERAAALSGARGLVIGFVFGVLIVGVMVMIYLTLLRR